jgi:hypothetical protein
VRIRRKIRIEDVEKQEVGTLKGVVYTEGEYM